MAWLLACCTARTLDSLHKTTLKARFDLIGFLNEFNLYFRISLSHTDAAARRRVVPEAAKSAHPNGRRQVGNREPRLC